MIKFYDTSALLELGSKAFDERFATCNLVLRELENIKVSRNKDEEVKCKARDIARLIKENPNKIDIAFIATDMYAHLRSDNLPATNDNLIVECADKYSKEYKRVTGEDAVFSTADVLLGLIADQLYGLNVDIVSAEEPDSYCGFLDITMNDSELAEFYSGDFHISPSPFTNQYLLLRNSQGEVVDCKRWYDLEFKALNRANFNSNYMGDVKPYKNDIYQQMAMDSLLNNRITMLKGPAGTGKSLLALGYLFYLLEQRKIERIVVFCNTVATMGSAKLGYYPGSREEKLRDSQIGNMLVSKLGEMQFNRLTKGGRLLLLPLSDLRGYDTTGMNAGVYITEAQNMDINLMKLAVQRVGEDSICIIDGDCDTQVDDRLFSGANNGMRRLSRIFRGEDIYGEVELRNIYRSRIASIAEKM